MKGQGKQFWEEWASDGVEAFQKDKFMSYIYVSFMSLWLSEFMLTERPPQAKLSQGDAMAEIDWANLYSLIMI